MHSWFGRGAWTSCWQGYGGVGMMIIGLLVLVALGFAVYWAVAKSRTGTGSLSEKTPLDILKERYAKGEISRDEYQQSVDDLK
ncbi:MAG: SHOCT domain-containing protein [Spirochaetaceae bacterium]|nr:SHOCT domain-containing protein [Spirochaetaceae bacterium]